MGVSKNPYYDLLHKAKRLIGKTLIELIPDCNINPRNKGEIGNLIQYYGFDIKANSDPAPDFKDLGIELKAVPLLLYSKRSDYRIKERTKICSINYFDIVHEKWETSHAKEKLNKIFFAFYQYDKINPCNSKIIGFFYFNLEQFPSEAKIFAQDWMKANKMINDGLAHEISESNFSILSASTSGPGGPKSIVDQPIQHLSKTAKQRSFSLKPSYMRVLWQQAKGKSFDSLYESFGIEGEKKVLNVVLDKLYELEGSSLKDLNKSYNLNSSAKNYASTLVRKILGFNGQKPIKEIEELGIQIKTIRFRNKDKKPWEDLSFPYQPLAEIIEEKSFEESELFTLISNGIIIIPVFHPLPDSSEKERIVGKAFFWKPSQNELKIIETEWKEYRYIISTSLKIKMIPAKTKSGFRRTSNLPKSTETTIIHMRPHATDGTCVDDTIPGIEITKQAFWINKSYLQKLVMAQES